MSNNPFDKFSDSVKRDLDVLFDDIMGSSLADMSELLKQIPGMNVDVNSDKGFNPYKIMELEPTATNDEVKERYRELVKILHPDKSGSNSTNTLFQMVQVSYTMICQERGIK